MRRYQNTLLAGVAALALVAGTGLASAQTPNGGTPSGQEHATQSPGGSSGMKAQGQGETNRTAQSPNAGMQHPGNGPGSQQAQGQDKTGPTAQKANGQTQQNAKVNGQNGQGAQQGMGTNHRQAERLHQRRTRGEARNEGRFERRRMERGRQSTAQRERTMHGLQGNASGQVQGNKAPQGTAENGGANGAVRGANVRLSEQQRTRIRETIIDARNAPRVDHVDFSVNVGTAIPREQFTTIHVVPVPEYLVRIEPRWRGFEYFIFTDEVVIVDPHDLRIVAIIPV